MPEPAPVYLDYNATAVVRPEVIEAVSNRMSRVGNASSVHAAGRSARADVEQARAEVAALVGADAGNVILLSGGTEANNLALKGFGAQRLIVSATEHGAVLAPALLHDPNAVILPVDEDGLIDLAALERALAEAPEPALVSVMRANNETGVLQPIEQIVELARRHGALVHCDGVQAAGKIPFDMAALDIDLLSLSAHKIGGPQGIGALVMRVDRPVRAEIVGGGQELGRRAGTENVAGAVGFGVAALLARDGLEKYGELAALRDEMEARIRALAPECHIFGEGVARLPNTSCLTMPGVKSDIQVMSFDLEGVQISAGSACSSGKVSASHVLEAMGAEDALSLSAVRISMGWATSRADIDRLVEVWQSVYSRLGRKAA